MIVQLIVLSTLFAGALSQATAVKQCSGDKPFPLEVRVYGCEVPPCLVIKGEDMEFDIDFVVYNFTTSMKTLVKATTLGVTVPYELPENVKDVCSNLRYGAYCPLYPEEDVTYKFLFPISYVYPEISVKIEIYIVDQVGDVVTCFVCDIKVRKGQTDNQQIE